jgi:hypothetical protein
LEREEGGSGLNLQPEIREKGFRKEKSVRIEGFGKVKGDERRALPALRARREKMS